MVNTMPYGATSDAQYSFSKTIVHDLEGMDRFYKAVFGLVELSRYDSEIGNRPISEIIYMSTYPCGGSLTLLKFNDAPGPACGESIQGFVTTDLQALVGRATASGGRVTDPIRRIDAFKMQVAFVADPEGHLIEVVQLDPA